MVAGPAGFGCVNGILFFGQTSRKIPGNAQAGQWKSPRAQRLPMFGGNMTLFSRSFVRKRVISFATTASMAVISLVMPHGPTSAHRIRQTMPIQYAADWQDNSDETAFLGENQTAMNKMMMDITMKPSGEHRSGFRRDDGAAPSRRGGHGDGRTQIRPQRTASPAGAGNHCHPGAGDIGDAACAG